MKMMKQALKHGETIRTSLQIALICPLLLVGCVSTRKGQLQQVETDYRDRNGQIQLTLDENSTIDDYLRYAALNNSGLEAAFNQWKAALERIDIAGVLPDPQLTYAYFIEAVETRAGPQRQKFEISQAFPWFGTLRLRKNMAAAEADAAYERYKAAGLRLFHTIKTQYYEYYYLSRAIAITERNVQLLSDLEVVARNRFKTGTAQHSSIIKAQVELGRLEDKLETLKDLRGPVTAKLNAGLNRRLDLPLPWPTATVTSDISLSEPSLPALLLASNPELKALDHAVSKAAAALKLAGRHRYPGIMLGAGMIETGDADMPGVDDSGKDPVLAMVGLSLPIHRGKYRSEIMAAQAENNAAKQMLKEKQNRLLADLQMALYHLRNAQRKITLYTKTLIPRATESLKVNRQAFESGQADFLSLIDSQRILLEFELAYERAQLNLMQRLSELEMLVGGGPIDSVADEPMDDK